MGVDELARHGVARGEREELRLVSLDELPQDAARGGELGVEERRLALVEVEEDELPVASGAVEVGLVAELVAAYDADPARLDPDLRRDWEAADGDAPALRVLVDQVASLTDVRAMALHRRWCRDTPRELSPNR